VDLRGYACKLPDNFMNPTLPSGGCTSAHRRNSVGSFVNCGNFASRLSRRFTIPVLVDLSSCRIWISLWSLDASSWRVPAEGLMSLTESRLPSVWLESETFWESAEMFGRISGLDAVMCGCWPISMVKMKSAWQERRKRLIEEVANRTRSAYQNGVTRDERLLFSPDKNLLRRL